MVTRDLIRLAALVFLLFLSGFFSSAEIALLGVNPMKLRTAAGRGDRRALMLIKIRKKPEKMLSAILIGNNIANLSASSLMTMLTIRFFGSAAIGIATGVLTLLVLVFGEITPKNMATRVADKMALAYAPVIFALIFILTPVISIVNIASGFVLRMLGIDPEGKKESMTEEELRTIVDVSHEEGVIEKEEKKMINNVFDFGSVLAKDIMIPRIDMVFADVDAGYEEIIEIYREERYTRLPVFEGSRDNVVGIVNVKDLLLADRSRAFSLREYMREPIYTYEYKKTAELLIEMKKQYNNIAIVLDEYGVTAGMITMEDILEEIVGEIRDEYDADEEESFIKTGKYSYLAEGSTKLDEINERLGSGLSSDDYESVGGLIMGLLDHLPQIGEEVTIGNLRLIVERMDKARVDRVKIEVLHKNNGKAH